MSALSVIEQRLLKWNKLGSLLPKPNKPLIPIGRLNELLKVCANSSYLRTGESIHAHLIVTNQSSRGEDSFQINSLINLYVKCGENVRARKLFDLMPDRNVVSWCAMMKGYQNSGFDFEVLKLFKSMFFSGESRPNEFVATVVLKSCSTSGRIEEGKQLHCYFLKCGLISHEYVRNTLVYMYSLCSGTREAFRILDHLPYCDLSVFSSALSGYLERGAFKEGADVLRRMAKEDLVWDNITYLSTLRLCSNLRDLDLARQIHSRMVRFGFNTEVEASGALINMYGKCGKVIYAQKVYDDTHARNIVLSTTIMDAYFQDKSFEEVLNLFAKMGTKDVPPNEYTFAIVLNSIAELSLLKQGDLIHGLVLKSGYRNHLMVGNALVNMYAKSGSIEDARKTFSGIAFKDIVTWNTLICGFSHHGLGKEALEAFDRMMYAGELPNRITFIGILQACSHTGFVEQGLYYFDQLMKQFNVQPDLQHYTCIVGLLSKAGLFKRAEIFMRTAPIEWDVVAWRALLNACYVRRNYSLGKQVAEYAIEKHPKDSGVYILLSNIHARSREWEDVAKVRSLMNKRGVKKEPGVSWIGIRNQTHVFLAEENQHPEIDLIYAKVKEVLSKIRPLGYSPDVAGDFHDVDEEQREDHLSYHSEKLAVAYGLMKTPENSPLYVTKNVRICDDCHSAIKLISKVSKRYIVIRDSNRFHHFRDGKCSCCDYW
ncbi:PREDICTED: pentatricopeptide repeat-containing protein At5g39680-like [Camelina sativa]|uniref:Pentatricopeptide repeat-containing protein At5g39680-like n=1 Tax=Camelina sativa TaxID=90675 RepID=A0ABM0U4X8_CAMSA|nr:PREDICTED: pentatricopeptide repeat-containing protein At5g39680-like [Camelina sativa]